MDAENRDSSWAKKARRLPDKSRSKRQAGPIRDYDTGRKIGMARADDAAGVYSGVGGVSERDHGDAHRDSWARSDHAKSCGHKCFRSEPDTTVAGAGAARGGPDL